MFNPFTLENKTILVTGASSGIGRQCAIDFSKMGAKVILVGRNEDRLKDVLSNMVGDGHLYYVYDLADLNGIKGLISTMVCDSNKFDGFVHSAGIELTKSIKFLTPEDYETVYRVNSLSAFELVHQLSSVKNFNKNGSIVLIASITSLIARGGVAAYSASKGAIVSAARVMSLELSQRNIRVNVISPGTVLTPLMQNYLSTLNKDDYNKRIEGFPLGLGETSDISNACIYLLSDASRWVTGQNLVVDGGYTIK